MEFIETMDKMTAPFSYEEFTTRNIGFVTEAQQAILQGATVFVCGTGGMGGACIMALTRAGIGRLIIVDIDEFAVSNLNRQVFAFTQNVGRPKAEATRDICLTINPQMQIDVYGKDWPAQAAKAIRDSAIVINGTDDLGASLLLYRTARELGRTVIDAYAAPLASVYVTKAGDPMPEERLVASSKTVTDAAITDVRHANRTVIFPRFVNAGAHRAISASHLKECDRTPARNANDYLAIKSMLQSHTGHTLQL